MVFNQRLGLVSSALFIWQFFSTVLFTSTALNLTSHDHLWLCCVRTSRDTSELQLCVLARPCGAIHCGWKPIPRGLTFGRTGLLFSAPCSWCLLNRKIQGQNRKDSRGDTMAWTLEKSIFCCCFSSRLYWNWAGGKTALLSELTASYLGQLNHLCWGFPGGSVVQNLPANIWETGSIPGLRRSPGEGNDYPLQYSCLENLMEKGAWWSVVHGVAKELDTT